MRTNILLDNKNEPGQKKKKKRAECDSQSLL